MWYCYNNSDGIKSVKNRNHPAGKRFKSINNIIDYFEYTKKGIKFKNCKVVFAWYDKRIERDVFWVLADFKNMYESYIQQCIAYVIID